MSNKEKFHVLKNIYHVLSVLAIVGFAVGALLADLVNLTPTLVLCGSGLFLYLVGTICNKYALYFRREAKREAFERMMREEQKKVMFSGDYTKISA